MKQWTLFAKRYSHGLRSERTINHGDGQVHILATAKRDLVGHYVFLGEQAGIETAERFLLQMDKSFHDLAMQPFMGVELVVRRPALVGVRKWQVKGFEKHLYRDFLGAAFTTAQTCLRSLPSA